VDASQSYHRLILFLASTRTGSQIRSGRGSRYPRTAFAEDLAAAKRVLQVSELDVASIRSLATLFMGETSAPPRGYRRLDAAVAKACANLAKSGRTFI
jgi:hypothetical protein